MYMDELYMTRHGVCYMYYACRSGTIECTPHAIIKYLEYVNSMIHLLI